MSATSQGSAKQELSVEFYLGFITGGQLLAGLLLLLARLMPDSLGYTGLFVGGLLALLFAFAVWIGFLHAAWSAIQDAETGLSPGRAVGFLFIPVFNLFWMFRSVGGYAAAYNAYAKRSAPKAPHLAEWPFWGVCILSLLSFIPFAGLVAAALGLVAMFMLVRSTCLAVNAL